MNRIDTVDALSRRVLQPQQCDSAPPLRCHIVEGEAGCLFAVQHGCVAVVVDALRASATAAMLCDAPAREILVVQEKETALRAKAEDPDALLFGERGGLPPEGFDYGNSPRSVSAARGRRVIFTTTTGAQRLVACWGAHATFMGTTVNAAAVVQAALAYERDVVLIPAGLAGHPEFDAQEDWVAAAYLAQTAGRPLGEGADLCRHWQTRIANEGIERLFASAPHAGKLRAIGLEPDIAWCAQLDVTRAVPMAVARVQHGVRVTRYDAAYLPPTDSE
jgi:2-phosphosulfolactate phosphatase